MKSLTFLLFTTLSCATLFAQNNPDSIEYDTELDGGIIPYEVRPDNYELDSFITMESILVDVNEKTGIANLQFGQVYELTFNLTNMFQQELVILGFSKPCLCIVPDWHKTPIAPGAVGFVKLKYTATVIGPSQKILRAYMFDAETNRAVAKVDITIKANVSNINSPN